MNDKPETPSGVLLIDKAQDFTSHDVVAVARGALGIRKIGHCGTLDPMATGLLILVIGKATKLSDLLMSEEKEYEGTMVLGKTTNSQDAQGEVEEEKDVPDFSAEQIDDAFNEYVGDFEQIPPMVSAIKIKGVPLYKMARKGKVVERKPRAVKVYDYQIKRTELPEVDFVVQCSKGFYVRTYVHDIGQDLGCGAHLSALRRTRSGKFDLSRAVTTEQLKHGKREDLLASMLTLEEVLEIRGV
ncbi:tRNA pseudouridine(55) synthase TruB [Persicirhabdus sediminis]|uniref:tRNA pseudouridine synthase B n=1 Tax=Persicirhabdus sediminis TaxID=454144 RepID=A0A8J7MDE2_9BACT|nr:tRNA pseudouridine(55) synthase TruB [Persicirhabdus sediminis]MBK1790535.1 tRNA pseudouridine(55) synthase TruB [Persicirhabdus sediminis]